MYSYSPHIKSGLLVIIFSMLILPFSQISLYLFLMKKRKLFFVLTEGVYLSYNRWISKDFQKNSGLYVNEDFGFRSKLKSNN